MLSCQECSMDPYNCELLFLENHLLVTNQNKDNGVDILNLQLKVNQRTLHI